MQSRLTSISAGKIYLLGLGIRECWCGWAKGVFLSWYCLLDRIRLRKLKSLLLEVERSMCVCVCVYRLMDEGSPLWRHLSTTVFLLLYSAIQNSFAWQHFAMRRAIHSLTPEEFQWDSRKYTHTYIQYRWMLFPKCTPNIVQHKHLFGK